MEEEEEPIQAKGEEVGTLSLTSSVESSITSQRESGSLLPDSERSFFEPRFGRDFSKVRLHADGQAGILAKSVQAKAFTVGRDIFLGRGEYQPGSSEGRRLLAHELTHVVQQDHAPSGQVDASVLPRLAAYRTSESLQRFVSPTVCAPDKISSVNVDSYRARGMLLKAGAKLSAYSASMGLWPSSVRSAMSRHFGTTIPQFAGILASSAGSLAVVSQVAAIATAYVCRASGSWPCSGTTLAWVPWCLPGTPIVLCDPRYFSQTARERSTTLIHEWCHKFWCRLDIGYEHESGYPSNLFTASVNADNFANLVRDLQ